MKNFFELVGFLFTALLTGFFVFTMIGRTERTGSREPQEEALVSKKNTRKNADAAMETPISARDEQELPQLPKIAKKSAKPAPAPIQHVADESGIESADLADLYADRSFVNTTVKEWKNTVENLAGEYSLKPEALMAYVVVKSYQDVYSKAQLRKDAARHAGDVVMSADQAAKRYQDGQHVQQIMRRFNLVQYFPQETESRTVWAGTGSGSKKTAVAPALAPKAAGTQGTAATANRGAGRAGNFKDMVAKEYGAKDWKTLQSKADAATKAKAEKRAKMLTTASVIR